MSHEITIALDEITQGSPKVLHAGGEEILVVRCPDGVLAVENRCPHARGPLHLGKIEGETIECPWHGAVFNLRNGSVQRQPSPRELKCFKTRIEGDQVHITSPDDPTSESGAYLPLGRA